MEERDGRIRAGERAALAAAGILAAAPGLLGPLAARAGRLCPLAPVLALPLGLWGSALWRRLGEDDLPRGLERAFGRRGGRKLAFGYWLWGLLLLAESARRYAGRLYTAGEGANARWLYLGGALAVCLWLGEQRPGAFARAGRLLFLGAAGALALAVVLAIPSVSWKELWPPEGVDWAGLPAAGGLCLTLAGYGVYALCLPRRGEEGEDLRPWALGGCGAVAELCLVTVGALGPALTARLDEPFLLLLQGVKAPGAFQRGEAALGAVLILADLVLLMVLTRGCMALWGEVFPRAERRWSILPAVGAFLAAGWPEGQELLRLLAGTVIPTGNLIAGVLIPGAAALLLSRRER